VSCSKDKMIRVHDIQTMKELLLIGEQEEGRHRGAVNAVNLSKDYIISASGDRSIRVWSIHTGALLAIIEAAHIRGVASLDFLPATPSDEASETGRVVKGTIVSGSSDASVKIFHLVTVPASEAMELVPPMRDLTFREMLDSDVVMSNSPQMSEPSVAGPFVADLIDLDDEDEDEDEDVRPENPQPRMLRIEEAPPCWRSCDCPQAMVPAQSSGCLRCWNKGHTDLVRSLCLKDDLFLSGSYDATVKIWDRATGRLLTDLHGSHTGRVFAVVGDKTRIISAGLDCRINIWNFAEGLDTSFVEP